LRQLIEVERFGQVFSKAFFERALNVGATSMPFQCHNHQIEILAPRDLKRFGAASFNLVSVEL